MKRISTILGKNFVLPMLSVLLLVLSSCNPDVELCYGEHPHRAHIVFDFEKNQYLSNPPSRLMMFVFRAKNRLQINGDWVMKSSTFIPDVGVDPLYSSENQLYAPTGEWTVSALSADYLNLNGDPQFINTSSLDKMWVVYAHMSYADEKLSSGRFRYWHDRNGYATENGTGYLASMNERPLLLGNSSFNVSEWAQSGDVIHVPMSFTPISQTVRVNIPISADDDITVDSVTSEVSGVCNMMKIGNRQVRVDSTFKVLFPMEIEKGYPTMARGLFYAPGIVSSQSHQFITGPGILSVMVFIHYFDDNGVKCTRTLEASINLFKQLAETPSILMNNLGQSFQSQPEITLDIPVLMHLTRTKILSVGDAGLDQWVDQTSIDMDF